jgi:hypothetical protein
MGTKPRSDNGEASSHNLQSAAIQPADKTAFFILTSSILKERYDSQLRSNSAQPDDDYHRMAVL